jgi:hypothetical protein
MPRLRRGVGFRISWPQSFALYYSSQRSCMVTSSLCNVGSVIFYIFGDLFAARSLFRKTVLALAIKARVI